MFPTPQDAFPLPPRPHLKQYKKQAKALVNVCRSGDPKAIRAWASEWIAALTRLSARTAQPEPASRIERRIDELETFARTKLTASNQGQANCVLADAQFVIARSHGFESWPKFSKHIAGLTRNNSPVAQFERAAEAIVAGDTITLRRLLRENPALVRARSTREHRATLLHYVSANGVETYRQETPKNAAKIAEILLKLGAEVDAEADVYGGGATPLGLVATSVHPERAGVQNELMEILLANGAAIDRPGTAGNRHNAVVGCLANGRGKAAEYLAAHGAQLDLEAAAGVGRLDAVKNFFHPDGNLKSSATKTEMQRGFLWACEYGRDAVIDFLLQHGADIHADANTGETALHWAVIGGHLGTIELLIRRGASLETKNAYGGDALGQALWSTVNGDSGVDYVPIMEALLDAGAKIEEGSLAWLARQENSSALEKQRVAEVLRRRGAKS